MKMDRRGLIIPALMMLAKEHSDARQETEVVKESPKPWRNISIPKSERKGKSIEELDLKRKKLWYAAHPEAGITE